MTKGTKYHAVDTDDTHSSVVQAYHSYLAGLNKLRTEVERALREKGMLMNGYVCRINTGNGLYYAIVPETSHRGPKKKAPRVRL